MKSYKVYKIIIAVIFAIITILSSIMLADVLITEQNIGTAFALAVWLVLAIPAFSVSAVLSLIGVIITAIKKKQGLCTVKTLVYFIVFTVLPVVVFFASVGIFNLVLN